MNTYITGAIIKRLREGRGMTQTALASKLNVSDKAVSRWETGKGYPDITLIEPLAAALGVSVVELLSGDEITNTNRAFNMKRSLFYVCPVCGNVMFSAGAGVVCCCGITLPALQAEEPDEAHTIAFETVEDEYYVTVEHEMSKTHYISFIAAVTDTGVMLTKLYPEQSAEARFKKGRVYAIYAYCSHHGLFKVLPMKKDKKVLDSHPAS